MHLGISARMLMMRVRKRPLPVIPWSCGLHGRRGGAEASEGAAKKTGRMAISAFPPSLNICAVPAAAQRLRALANPSRAIRREKACDESVLSVFVSFETKRMLQRSNKELQPFVPCCTAKKSTRSLFSGMLIPVQDSSTFVRRLGMRTSHGANIATRWGKAVPSSATRTLRRPAACAGSIQHQ